MLYVHSVQHRTVRRICIARTVYVEEPGTLYLVHFLLNLRKKVNNLAFVFLGHLVIVRKCTVHVLHLQYSLNAHQLTNLTLDNTL